MPYPEPFVAPMRAELTRLGVRELRTPEQVDEAVRAPGTVMIVVNSICGCAAGKARPGVALALQHAARPDLVATVFAGADIEATDRARSYFTGYMPSSPSVALLRDGKMAFMLERRDIENRDAQAIAQQLTGAFDRYCTPAVKQVRSKTMKQIRPKTMRQIRPKVMKQIRPKAMKQISPKVVKEIRANVVEEILAKVVTQVRSRF